MRPLRHGCGELALRLARAALVTIVSLVLYNPPTEILQLANAWGLVQHLKTTGDIYDICTLILAIYGIGLIRAPMASH
jgi:hypothetical protein